MREIILTDKQKREVEKLKAEKLPYIYGPPCVGCGQAFPVQMLMYVTKWRTREWGSTGQKLNVHVPVQMWCKPCKERGYVPRAKKEDHGYYASTKLLPQFSSNHQPVKLRAKDIARLILAQMSYNKPSGSKKLARMAGIGWSPKIVTILTRLHKLKLVKYQDGRWIRRLR